MSLRAWVPAVVPAHVQGSLSRARLGRLRGGEEPQGTKGRVEREEKTSQLGPFVFGQILGL